MKNFLLILTLLFTFGSAAFFARNASKAGLMQSGCEGCIFEHSTKAEDHLSYENCPYPEEFAKARAAEEAAKLAGNDDSTEDDLSLSDEENQQKNSTQDTKSKQNENSMQKSYEEAGEDLEPDYGMD